ncbi:MAG: 3-oxoacyl-(acyl-carrier-protein) synthase [Solirubrobacterales bacterium]|nr:3-oxoacyl-(acyl-carrier-protein) synthase [Solirubrobacterales bacterium]
MASRPDTLVEPAAPAARVRTAGIAGLGTALPPRVVGSDAIAARLGVEAGWIERRTGIRSRRHAGPGTTVASLASAAGAEALDAAGVLAEQLDLILVATLSPDDLTPNTAPRVAHALGAERAGAIDVGAACTGFVSALGLGAAVIEAGRAEHVLVIGAEVLSRFLDRDDKRTAGLFGDGAGAAVLSAGEHGRIGPVVLGADGSAAALIRARHDDPFIRMDGHETFKLAVSSLASCTRDAVGLAGLELADVDLFVYHQANGRILSTLADTLGLDPGRVLDVIGELGNTSAASIPLALGHASREGLLAPGARVLLAAVGAGFTWGATVVEWGRA